ncbi:signal recognition particle-docking protein FtsY [Alteromonas sp. ASW11-36]|uniref:Signal recognition particle receptor FtsY n=1 Tax=Alteromonas arenosi TaxID=3055817 RepID=A0ABT7SYN0_9ALTE|nr:signal recognition particle-docking protein FtsY [Alteromonas sp. ASW11-36]MDM7861297.1 signal recognition particle-docking protein FtsY [Alteromonas sp. ASW11-36]
MSKFFDWFNKDKKKPSTPEPTEKTHQQSVPEEQSSGTLDEAISETPAPQSDVASTAPIVKETVTNEIEVTEASAPLVEPELSSEPEIEPVGEPVAEPEAPAKPKFMERLKAGLSRTKQNIGTGFVALFKGKSIDEDLYEELETQLLVADVGMDTTNKIITRLTENAKLSQLKDGEALYGMLKQDMQAMLDEVDKPLVIDNAEGPFVILMVGVNGVGKTTTIGKLAKQYQQQGKRVMLAAGDTFRAAAVEQLQVWGERNDIPVIAQHTGADSASVLFDALQSAEAKGADVLIADTAGRLQNKDNLMEELKKVVRVMRKVNPNAPHEIMLTLDAGTGQNAISQAKLFSEAVGVTGITLSKLDGTAKGGVIFAIADQLQIPIRYIGVGEGIDDLRAFNSRDFIDALFTEGDSAE